VQSLFYADFFEDPMTWGLLAVAAGTTLMLPSEKSALSGDAAGTQQL